MGLRPAELADGAVGAVWRATRELTDQLADGVAGDERAVEVDDQGRGASGYAVTASALPDTDRRLTAATRSGPPSFAMS